MARLLRALIGVAVLGEPVGAAPEDAIPALGQPPAGPVVQLLHGGAGQQRRAAAAYGAVEDARDNVVGAGLLWRVGNVQKIPF